MNTRLACLSILCCLSFVAPAPAQVPGTPEAGLFGATLKKLFGAHTAFAATTDVHIFNKAGQETTAMTMEFATRSDNARIDVDTASIRTKDVPADLIAQFKSMGMDKMSTIMRPDKKTTFVIYPGLKAYAEITMSPDEAAARAEDLKMEKTVLGKETVDGHPTQKTKVVLTGKAKERKDAVVWYATDLKDFPVKMQITEGPTTMVMIYRNISLAAPETKLFEAPTTYAKHPSIEQLVQSELMKRVGAGGKAK